MITVIAGGMYSEKTTELQRRGKRLTRAGKSVVFVKPDMDNRYAENHVVTHDGVKVESTNIPVDEPEKIYEIADDYEVFCIDEVQFFSEKIVQVVSVLANHGRTVIVAGLDLAHDGTVFLPVALLMGAAEEVVKLNAVCGTCGSDSWITEKIAGSDDRLELGSDDKYRPICRKCLVFKKIEESGGNENEL